MLRRIKRLITYIENKIFYLFNKKKVEKKLEDNKEYVSNLTSIGIENKMTLYRTVVLAEDFRIHSIDEWVLFKALAIPKKTLGFMGIINEENRN